MMPAEFVVTRDKDVLRWVQPVAGNRYHELRSSKGVHAKLKWKGMYGSLAYVHTNDGTFTLKRGGFLHPKVTVRMRPRNREIASFDVDLGITGTIRFGNDDGYDVSRPNILRRRWVVRSIRPDWDDRPLMTIEKRGSGKMSGEVYFRADPRFTKFLVLTSAIIWYSFILSIEEWAAEPEGPKEGGSG
jgi:hypothetical protein